MKRAEVARVYWRERALIERALECSRQYLYASDPSLPPTTESQACAWAHPRCTTAELHSDEWTRGYLECIATGFPCQKGVGDHAAVSFVVAQIAAEGADADTVRYVARLAVEWAEKRTKN